MSCHLALSTEEREKKERGEPYIKRQMLMVLGFSGHGLLVNSSKRKRKVFDLELSF